MTNKSVRPEDILGDNETFVQYEGGTVRKGSFAAIMANADILESHDANQQEKDAALEMIKSLLPLIVLSGAYKHITWNNPKIQKFVNDLVCNKK